MAARSNRKNWLDDLLGDEDDDQEVQPARRSEDVPTTSTAVTSESNSTRFTGRRSTGSKSVRFMDSFVNNEEDSSSVAFTSPATSTPQANFSSASSLSLSEPNSVTTSVQVFV